MILCTVDFTPFSAPNHRYFLHKLHLVNYIYFCLISVTNFLLACIYPRKTTDERGKKMNIEFQDKIKINISPKFIIAISGLITVLHEAGII